ncbi:unnamed protein product, partial [Brachionus calyciflorus]
DIVVLVKKKKLVDDEDRTSKKQNTEQVRAVEQVLPPEINAVKKNTPTNQKQRTTLTNKSNQRETPKSMRNKKIENEVNSTFGTKTNKTDQEM